MAGLLTGDAEIVMEVAQIAAAPGEVAERAKALLEPLRRVTPFDAAWICLLDVERRGFVSLVTDGYSDACREYFESPTVFEETLLLGLDRKRPPMCRRDMPVRAEDVRGCAEYMLPAGFRDGIGAGLFTPDGRHIGMLTLNTDTAAYPTDAARDLIGMLAPLIAHAVDPMRSVGSVAGIVHDAASGVAVTRAGTALPLPGLPPHPVLATGSLAVEVAGGMLTRCRVHSSFLCPYENGHVRITALAAPPGPPYHFTAIVVLTPAGDVQGLTARELEVLGLLTEGWSNRTLAVELGVAERTVAAHVEHLLVKLAVTSRTAAAITAQRLGLYVPRLLHHATRAADPGAR
jgi:DNA-binding CsgD family transcriptional regulator